MIRIQEVMSKEVFSCHMNDSLNRAAQIMNTIAAAFQWWTTCQSLEVRSGKSRRLTRSTKVSTLLEAVSRPRGAPRPAERAGKIPSSAIAV
jgi:hypothetical protein